MVEAAVVMPVLIMFYGLSVFIYQCYEAKSSVLAETRHEAFRAALHQCEGTGAPRRTATDAPSLANALGAPYVDEILNHVNVTPYMEIHGMKATSRAEVNATNAPLSRNVLTHTFNSESQVFCVPRTIGGSGTSYVAPARRESVSQAYRGLGSIIDELRVLFNEKI